MSDPNHSLPENHGGLVDTCVAAQGDQHCHGSGVSLVNSRVQEVGHHLESYVGGFLATIQTYWMEFDVHDVRIPINRLLFIHIFLPISLLDRFLLFIVILCFLWL
jgi:hypothetical protein